MNSSLVDYKIRFIFIARVCVCVFEVKKYP